MQVGVVGLGAIGKAVATNLVTAGFRTIVWNRSSAPAEDLASRGAIAAAEVAEVLHSDIVLSVLFDDAAVCAVFLDSGVLAEAKRGSIHACLSTISTEAAQRLAAAHAAHGIGYVAAPVFGRPDAAAAAKLVIATAGRPTFSIASSQFCACSAGRGASAKTRGTAISPRSPATSCSAAPSRR